MGLNRRDMDGDDMDGARLTGHGWDSPDGTWAGHGWGSTDGTWTGHGWLLIV